MKFFAKFLLTFLLFGNSFVFGQNDEISQIKEYYYYIQENIEHQKNGDIPADSLHIVLEQNMPAIGPQIFTYNFYFSMPFDDETYEYYHSLSFVKRTYNVAASMYVYEEFLYNGIGDLVFYYMKYETETCKEIRYYFSDKKLIKAEVRELKIDGDCQKFDNYEVVFQSNNKFPEFYTEEFTDIYEKSQNIKDIFKIIDKSYY